MTRLLSCSIAGRATLGMVGDGGVVYLRNTVIDGSRALARTLGQD